MNAKRRFETETCICWLAPPQREKSLAAKDSVASKHQDLSAKLLDLTVRTTLAHSVLCLSLLWRLCTNRCPAAA